MDAERLWRLPRLPNKTSDAAVRHGCAATGKDQMRKHQALRIAAFLSALFLCGSGAQAEHIVGVHAVNLGCLKYPNFNPFFLRGNGGPEVRKFFADFQLQADPSLPPKVEVVYSNLHPRVQAFFIEYLESVRWTCAEPVDTQTRIETAA